MPTAIDLFEKARSHERLEQLRAARDHDLMPYFRVLEGPAGPVVEMEGKQRIMLGSNNYLGLTGDERVKDAARDALERFGTGLTGSRFLNGTLSLHLDHLRPDTDDRFDPVLHPLPGARTYEWTRRLREPAYAEARRPQRRP